MKRYKYLLLIVIILLLAPIFGFGERRTEDRDLLMGILGEVGADFVEGDIDIGGIILDEFISKEEMLLIGSEIREHLGIKGHLSLEEYYFEELIEEEGFIQLMVQGMDEDKNLATITLSTYEDVDGNGETSLFINFTKKVQFVEINDIIVKVENFFHKYDSPVNITICVVGAFDEDSNLEEIDKNILKTIKLVKGKLIEEYREDGILSYSVFTPYIEEYIYTGSRKMNLNIGLRFNEYENKNYIWIGTPIISIGY
jgi:hypothetical protein